MHSLKILVLLSLAMTSSCGMMDKSRDREKAQLHMQLGSSLYSQKNYPQALSELLEAERLDPNNPLIQNNLALTYLVRDKMEIAETHFKKALALDPKFTDARNNLGSLYISVGFFEKAIEELKIATADLTYSEPEKSWANLGQAYFNKGDYSAAKEAFQNSLKERRESCYTMNLYGRSLFELKNYTSAAESLDQAIRLCEKSKFDEPHFYSGLSYYKLGNIEQAHARLSELVQLYPQSRFVQKAKDLLEVAK
jgi:type IV pilus assembly protein PilF